MTELHEYIVFLSGTFGNDAGDVVRVESTDDEGRVYYTDCYDRWCYMERNAKDIAIIEAADLRQAKRKAEALA